MTHSNGGCHILGAPGQKYTTPPLSCYKMPTPISKVLSSVHMLWSGLSATRPRDHPSHYPDPCPQSPVYALGLFALTNYIDDQGRNSDGGAAGALCLK